MFYHLITFSLWIRRNLCQNFLQDVKKNKHHIIRQIGLIREKNDLHAIKSALPEEQTMRVVGRPAIILA